MSTDNDAQFKVELQRNETGDSNIVDSRVSSDLHLVKDDTDKKEHTTKPKKQETNLLTGRAAYRPFKYPQAYDFFLRQQQAHWLWTEVNMAADVADFRENLTESERHAVITLLRSFTQIELNAEDYWAMNVAKWFPHPEIQQMAATNGAFEAIHISAYDYLNQSLGLPESEYTAFLKEKDIVAKKKRLAKALKKTKTKKGKALSLAIFSAFTEGVSLYSSFAILINFSRFNKLKGVANIIAWSVRDESLHSEAGCWLFREFIQENQDIWTDDFKKHVYQAARDTVELEDATIDKIFEKGDMEGLTAIDLKNYIRYRADTKLNDLGLKRNWKNLDMESVGRVTKWLDPMLAGNEHTDFFALKPTSYSKGHVDWNSLDFDLKK